jgi:hypothetical protein
LLDHPVTTIAPASRNETTSGDTNAAIMKTTISRRRTNRGSPREKYRTSAAPSAPSPRLVRKSSGIVVDGTPFWICTARCAGTTARM